MMPRFFVALLALLSMCLLQCQSSDEHKAVPVDPRPALLSLTLVDAPIDQVTAANVSIERVDVRACNDAGWTRTVVDKTFDLLSLRYGVGAPLFTELSLPPGGYCELRFIIGPNATLVLDDGQVVPVKFPSGVSSGIKIKGQWELIPGAVTRIAVDFDTKKSFSVDNKGRWKGHPVLQVASVLHSSPSDGPVPGATFIDRIVFTVDPADPITVALPGDAELQFDSGSVAQPQQFEATIWRPASDAYSSYVYTFEPQYDFLTPPTFKKVLGPAEPFAIPTIYVDGVAQPTTAQNGSVAASIRHFTPICVDEDYSDVSISSEYHPYIKFLRCRGVMQGYPDGTFRPDQVLTRAELLKVTLELSFGTLAIVTATLAKPELFPMPFPDVPNGHWAWRYIAFAARFGIVSGDPATGNFRPDEGVNRAEAAKMLVEASRNFSLLGWTGSADRAFSMLYWDFYANYALSVTDSPFSDADTDDWFFDYAIALRAANAIKRRDEFFPGNALTRKEVARIAYLMGSKFNHLRRRIFCASPDQDGCVTTLSERAHISQMYLEYGGNPTADGYHAGIDFGGADNIVYAPAAGQVTRVTDETQCGIVVVRDANVATDTHIFLHMKDIKVALNDNITAGTRIGTSSNSVGLGCMVVGGAHLHYEIRRGKETIKPLPSDADALKSTADQTHNPADFVY